MSCVDSSRLCMSGLSLCDLCLCYSILGSQFSNKYLLTYYNAPRRQYMCVMCAQPSSRFVARRQTSSHHPTNGFLTYPTSVLLITESWKCYSGSVNILCNMLLIRDNTSYWQTDDHWSSDWLAVTAEGMSYGQTWTNGQNKTERQPGSRCNVM